LIGRAAEVSLPERMIRTRITVLGGSNPFTAALIDAFWGAAHQMPPCELVLHGRNSRSLQCVTQYGKHCMEGLDWRVRCSTDLGEAIAGAYIVIHQIRYGGLEGRAQDETIALRFQLPPDETLGPGALHAILRTLSGLKKVSAELVKTCPDAWVLNLTNPLSLVTSLMIEAGVKRCIGLCELPLVTARQAAEVLELPFAGVEWDYLGLNHRGFIVRLSYAGADRIGELAKRLTPGTIGGVTAAEIAQLCALPTKYFRLISGGEPPRVGRAAFLSSLRNQIAEELARDPTTSPPSLGKRYLEWYPQAVVPMIIALFSAAPMLQIANVEGAGGLVEECQAWVSASSFKPIPPPKGKASSEVCRWLRIYRSHEEAVLHCVRSPNLANIAQALREDPVVSATNVLPMARTIWECYKHSLSVEN
jgi:6-phospho-beta-glucosidase